MYSSKESRWNPDFILRNPCAKIQQGENPSKKDLRKSIEKALSLEAAARVQDLNVARNMSLRAKRSNLTKLTVCKSDCFVAPLLPMTTFSAQPDSHLFSRFVQ